MLRKFLKDVRGSYTIATVVAMVPIMGGLALAIDFSEMNRQRQATMNALDAANVATGYRFAQGATDEQIKAYAKEFFEANLGPVKPADTVLHVELPNSPTGGGTLKMAADLIYKPYFYPAFTAMLNGGEGATQINFRAKSEVRLKNTLEVALVLDNSGSMDYQGTGSGKKRLDLLKEAAKQLVDTIAMQAGQMKQVDKPVQFALVPFAASVNVGPDNADEPWMDRDGISPIHHENFAWPATLATDKTIEKVGGVYYKKGSKWGSKENEKVTRFTLYDDIRRITGYAWSQSQSKWVPRYGSFAKWEGCVEARPYPHNTTDAAPVSGIPATLFVPWFAPDETDQRDQWNRPSNNNWWTDLTTSSSAATRQRYMPKYFKPAPLDDDDDPIDPMGLNEGPNAGCTTVPITPLVDVSTSAGISKIKGAIDSMISLGATNVPEGLAWGWRTVSGGAPFTEGRGDSERGNDKVVIVLTDGENTYYTPDSVSANDYSGGDWWRGAHDFAGNKSMYSAFGYTGQAYNGGDTRLFRGTSTAVSKTDYSNGNYGKALNEQMAAACGNAKSAGLIVMTVALDLDATKDAQKKQIDGLKNCASESRFSGEKLFWNTKGGDLAETFKKIADELSNLRIVG